MKKYDIRNLFKNFVRGSLVGIAEIVPGISGSTIALIMGIYDDFIDLLDSLVRRVKELISLFVFKIFSFTKVKIFTNNSSLFTKKIDWAFGTPFLLGIILTNLIFANVISVLFSTYSNYIQGFFFGLILASLYIPLSKIQKFSLVNLVIIVIFSILTFIFIDTIPSMNISQPDRIFLFFAGIVGVVGMALPGVSGAFILLVLGVYEYVVGLVKKFTRLNINLDDLINILVFACGLIIGLIFFLKLIKFSFSRFPNITLSILSGLMIGSIKAVFPFYNLVQSDISGKFMQKTYLLPWDPELSSSPAIILICVFLGLLSSLLIKLLADKQNLNYS